MFKKSKQLESKKKKWNLLVTPPSLMPNLQPTPRPDEYKKKIKYKMKEGGRNQVRLCTWRPLRGVDKSFSSLIRCKINVQGCGRAHADLFYKDVKITKNAPYQPRKKLAIPVSVLIKTNTVQSVPTSMGTLSAGRLCFFLFPSFCSLTCIRKLRK